MEFIEPIRSRIKWVFYKQHLQLIILWNMQSIFCYCTAGLLNGIVVYRMPDGRILSGDTTYSIPTIKKKKIYQIK